MFDFSLLPGHFLSVLCAESWFVFCCFCFVMLACSGFLSVCVFIVVCLDCLLFARLFSLCLFVHLVVGVNFMEKKFRLRSTEIKFEIWDQVCLGLFICLLLRLRVFVCLYVVRL